MLSRFSMGLIADFRGGTCVSSFVLSFHACFMHVFSFYFSSSLFQLSACPQIGPGQQHVLMFSIHATRCWPDAISCRSCVADNIFRRLLFDQEEYMNISHVGHTCLVKQGCLGAKFHFLQPGPFGAFLDVSLLGVINYSGMLVISTKTHRVAWRAAAKPPSHWQF